MSFKRFLQGYMPSLVDDSDGTLENHYSVDHSEAVRYFEKHRYEMCGGRNMGVKKSVEEMASKGRDCGYNVTERVLIDALTIYFIIVKDICSMMFVSWGNAEARKRHIRKKVLAGLWNGGVDDYAQKLVLVATQRAYSDFYYKRAIDDSLIDYSKYADDSGSDPKLLKKQYHELLNVSKQLLSKMYSLICEPSARLASFVDYDFEQMKDLLFTYELRARNGDTGKIVWSPEFHLERLRKFLVEAIGLYCKDIGANLPLFVSYILDNAFDNCHYLWDKKPGMTARKYFPSVVKQMAEMLELNLTDDIRLMAGIREEEIYQEDIDRRVEPLLKCSLPSMEDVHEFSNMFNAMVRGSGFVNTELIPL